VERAVFLTVLHRLMQPGSDRAADHWKVHYPLAGVAGGPPPKMWSSSCSASG
jgi:hypothetical protein